MVVKILHSGSDGNCCVVRDFNNNQILLDCGIGNELIIPELKLKQLDCLLLSHYHSIKTILKV